MFFSCPTSSCLRVCPSLAQSHHLPHQTLDTQSSHDSSFLYLDISQSMPVSIHKHNLWRSHCLLRDSSLKHMSHCLLRERQQLKAYVTLSTQRETAASSMCHTLTGWSTTPYMSSHLTRSRKLYSARAGTWPLLTTTACDRTWFLVITSHDLTWPDPDGLRI